MRSAFAMAVLMMAAVAAPAAAQNARRFEVSGGYSWLRETQADQTFNGWVASGAVYVNRWLGIVGDFGQHFEGIDPEPGLEVRFNELSYMGGVRFAGASNRAVSAFAQVAAGGVRFHSSIRDSTVDESQSVTKFALQPGGGVDVFFSRNVGVRAGGDYRRVFVNEMGIDGINEWRFHVGLVIRGGR